MMTNEQKQDFIRANYKSSRALELWKGDKRIFLEEWAAKLLEVVPSRLYKYRTCNRNNLNALKNKKAWFSNPKTWNDQIDVTVDYDLERDVKYLEDHFDDYVIRFALGFVNHYIESFCQQKNIKTVDEIKAIYYSAFAGDETLNLDRIVKCLEPAVGWKPARQMAVKTQEAINLAMSEDFKKQITDSFQGLLSFNSIRDKVLMYSLSETYDNNHQWAMYAGEGTGFCIGYHIVPKNDFETKLLTNLLPIYYGERKALSIPRMLSETLEYAIRPEQLSDLAGQEAESLFVSLYTKTKEWSGEQEWRFAIPVDQTSSNLLDFDFAESIYLGENITDYWKRRLFTIARSQNLRVLQRKLNATKSKWIYEEVKY